MWSVPRSLLSEDERCDRLLAQYEEQIAQIEASKRPPFWDGYCGLVKVQDEDDVRPDTAVQTAGEAPLRQQVQQAAAPAQQQERQDPQRQHPLHKYQQHQRQHSSSSAGTPPAGASPRGGGGSRAAASPFKPAPGARQGAAELAEEAARLLHQQGRVEEAESLLRQALRRCPLTDTQLAARIVDLSVEAQREQQQTPTHSRAPSEVAEQLRATSFSGSGRNIDGDAPALLQQALDALAAGQARRAEQALLDALAACPLDLPELRGRLQLYLDLVHCKRQS